MPGDKPTAPAALPSDEEIARMLSQVDEQNGGPPYDMRVAMGKHVMEPLFDQARAVLSLFQERFAPILAEKDVAKQHRDSAIRYAAECSGRAGEAEARALAAESALAAAREEGAREATERAAKIADDSAAISAAAGETHPEDSESRGRCFARAREARSIAAAIRAQGE